MNRPLIVSLAGAVVVLIALILTYTVGREEEEDAIAPPQQSAAVETPRPAMEDGDPAAPSAPVDTGKAPGPSFDVVRIDREGNAVMAGRAGPGTEVVITDGDRELGRVTADSRGEWVFLPDQPLPPGTRELALRSVGPEGGDGLPGEGSVVLMVPEPGAGADRPPLAVQTTPGEPSRVLQAPAPVLAEETAPADGGEGAAWPTVIDVVDYDADGNLSFGGRAAPGTVVLGYLDNVFVGRATADDQGRWSITVENPVAAGRHTIRADALAPDGDVMARAEIPFVRPESLDVPEGDRTVVVQPGNSLWRIARRTLGSGADFTLIYEANRAQIRDPDLIYPGQIIILPTRAGDNG